LHDEIPQGVRGSVDEVHSLRVAPIGRCLVASRLPIKSFQGIECGAQVLSKAVDCCGLLLADLILKDVRLPPGRHVD
jgi:hypothetical protein